MSFSFRLEKRLRVPCVLGFALAVLGAQSALAQTVPSVFPSKPVRIVVPQTPGGASDALARMVGQKLSEKWGQPVVVENRAGAGGNIGMDVVAKALGDGYPMFSKGRGTKSDHIMMARIA